MRILLLTPSTFGYETRIRAAFEGLGYRVDWMDERIGNDVPSKAATRLGLLRLAPGLLNRHVARIEARLRETGADHLIAVNPETLRGPEFTRLRAAFPHLRITVYRWDSLSQKPLDEATMAAADAVYSFDPTDCDGDPRLRHLPLFHNYAEPPEPPQARDPSAAQYALSFVGTAQMRRVEVLGRLCRALEREGRPYFFHLMTQTAAHQALFAAAARRHGYTGGLSRERLPYERFLEVVARSTGVVDIEFSRQSGLTMRTFEVVFSGMPLLTTNPSILRYDFSAEAPVFPFDPDDPVLPDMAGFRGAGSGAYFEKYSIRSWACMLATGESHHYYRGTETANLAATMDRDRKSAHQRNDGVSV